MLTALYNTMFGQGSSSGHAAATGAGSSSATRLRVLTPLSLVDMPQPWLEDLPALAGDGPCLSLLMSCRAMRDLVLEMRRVRVDIRLPKPEYEPLAELQIACKYAKKIKLFICGERNDPCKSTARASSLLSSAMVVNGALSFVTDVVLRELEVDGLAPEWLTRTCPHVTSLEFQLCRIARFPDPRKVPIIPTCATIKELRLNSSTIPRDDPVLSNWRHQLKALTGLKSLHSDGRMTLIFPECCSVLAPRLTQLCFTKVIPETNPETSSTVNFATWFVGMKDLQLCSLVLDDQGMDTLLGLRTLQKVEFQGLKLTQHFNDRPCPWTQLGFWELDVISFDRIPLEGVQLVWMGLVECIVYPCNSLLSTEKVVAAVAKCNAIAYCKQIVVENRDRADSWCIAALMPMFATYKVERFTLAKARPIDADLLEAMKKHLPTPPLHAINLVDGTIQDDMWRALLPGLPPVGHLAFKQWGTAAVAGPAPVGWAPPEEPAAAPAGGAAAGAAAGAGGPAMAAAVALFGGGAAGALIAADATAARISDAHLIEMITHARTPCKIAGLGKRRVLMPGWQKTMEDAQTRLGHLHVRLSR